MLPRIPSLGVRFRGAAVVVVAAALGVATPAEARRGGRDLRPAAARSSDRRTVVDGIEALAFDVHGQLAARPGNFAFSPLSLGTALAMASHGAAGRTRAELTGALRADLPPSRLAAAFRSVLSEVAAASGDEVRVDSARAIFSGSDVDLRRSFRTSIVREFGARSFDLAGDPGAARAEVDAWAAERTGGNIRSLFPRDGAPDSDALVLADSLFFRGTWSQAFPTRSDEPFRTATRGAVVVPMMRVEGNFRASFGEDVVAVELPYRGDDVAMVVAMPGNPAAQDAAVSREGFAAAVAGFEEIFLRVELPAFAVASETDLAETLRTLGVERSFTGAADFSRAVRRGRPARIDGVRQSASVRVDEEGTVAAAVTTVLLTGRTQAHGDEPRPFRVDRPFVFAIRDRRSGAILFLGRIDDPTR